MTTPAPHASTPPDAAEAPTEGSRVMLWTRRGLSLAGLVVLGLIVRHVGLRAMAETLRPALVWLPLLFVLEALKVLGDTLASHLAYTSLGVHPPFGALVRAHVVGHAVMSFAPAPRTVNEAVKATLLAPHVGAAAAAATGFVNQASTLLSVGLFSLPLAAATYALRGTTVLFWACLGQLIVVTASGLVLRLVTRAKGPGRWIAKKFPRFATSTNAFAEQTAKMDLWARGPTGAMLLVRVLHGAQFWVAMHALGIETGAIEALQAQAVTMLAATVGVLVPGGLGTTDGAFALSANILRTDVLHATSLVMLLRLVQLSWLAVGSVAMLLPTTPPRPRSS